MAKARQGAQVNEQCSGSIKSQKIWYQCPGRDLDQPNDSLSMKWASTYIGVLSPPPSCQAWETIFSAYTQLNLSNGIHVGTIFHIGMEGCLHHLQESGVPAKGNDPTKQAREIDNFSSCVNTAASNTWAVKILEHLHSKARKQIPCVYEIQFSPKQSDCLLVSTHERKSVVK